MVKKFNTKLSLLLLLTLFLLITLPSYCQEEEKTSPEEELFECFVSCGKKQHQPNQHELSQCEQISVNHYQERKREERQERGGCGGDWDELCQSTCEGSREKYQCTRICKHLNKQLQQQIRGTAEFKNHHDPLQQYKQCQSKCGLQQHGEEQRQLCQQKCHLEYEKRKRKQIHEHGQGDVENPRAEQGEEEEQENKNPYFFESQRFNSKYRIQHGHIKVLERFSKRSELLQGIENYRLAILEANPNTFVIPHHCDAESVFAVIGGTISFVWQNQRQSFNLKHGDVIRVPAGSLVYLINHDDNEKLYVLKLLQPVNTPGRFKEYFGVGGENPESFYRTFSTEILEAAFNAPRERLEKLFGQQQKGVIIKASKEQIRALSQKSESYSGKRRGGSFDPFNLLNDKPLFSSQYGQFFEANPENFEQLKDLDVSVAFMNIKKMIWFWSIR